MTNSPIWQENSQGPHTCVIIPTFNNQATLAAVIEDAARYTQQIIVVNDGSTDQTTQILARFPFLLQISYPTNIGKGWALRKGFALALQHGYRFAITMDADGQHFGKDLPVLLQCLSSQGEALIIGARNMDQDGIPSRSNFGKRFSNFWFWLETGLHCPDTQSGLRLYPIARMRGMRLFSRKYELEIEVLVRAAWRGIKIASVPVSVYYPPKKERVSHFRPFWDFARISVLNCILVPIALLYIKPRDLLRYLGRRGNLRRLIQDALLHPRESDRIKAASVGFGLCMGILPIWGFQLLSAISLAYLFRLNKALVILAANISVPPMIPLIIFASYKMGAFWMDSRAEHLTFSHRITLASVGPHVKQYVIGSIILAVVVGVLSSLIVWIVLKTFKRNRGLRA
jgi:glycosyltransferase involved in cell wall biosynthesis